MSVNKANLDRDDSYQDFYIKYHPILGFSTEIYTLFHEFL